MKYYGNLIYKEKEYPYYMDNYIVTIIQKPREYNADFSDVDKVEVIQGITNEGKYIEFLDCEFLGGCFRIIYSNLVFKIQGFVIHNNCDDKYDRIRFTSKALNSFFTPKKSVDIGKCLRDKNYNGSFNLQIKPTDDNKQTFNTTIDNQTIENEIYIPYNINLDPNNPKIGELTTAFNMNFNESINNVDIPKYYLYLYDFLTYMTFRRTVAFDEILLYTKGEKGYQQIGQAFIKNIESNIKYDCSAQITFDDIGIDNIGKLFEEIAQKRINNDYNTFFIPQDDRDEKTVDSIKFLTAALSFEGEFTKKHKNLRADQDDDFKSLKEELQKLIKDKSKEVKDNKGFELLYYAVKNVDTSIKEKFKFMLDNYSEEIAGFKKQRMRSLEITDNDEKLVKRYGDYRSTTAHGTINPIENTDILNYELAKMFTYILIFENAEIPKENIKKMIGKIFK